MWSKLQRVYSQQSLPKILQLCQQLQNIKKGSNSISDFVLKIKNIGDALMAAGEEENLMANLLKEFIANCVLNLVMVLCNAIGVLINNFRDLLIQITKIAAYYATPYSVNDQAWYVDSGATNHVTADMNNLSLKFEYRGNHKLIVGDGNILVISNIGDSRVASHTIPSHQVKLNNILHVPSITKNLLSISKSTKIMMLLLFLMPMSYVCSKNQSPDAVLGTSHVNVNTCNNRDTKLSSTAESCNGFSALVAAKNNSVIWHAKLGHPAPLILKKVLDALHFPYNVNAPLFCNSCKLGKLHKLPFARSEIHATAQLQLVLFPHTHQQNGIFERKHRHIIEMALTLLAYGGMPLKFWYDACCTIIFLINNLPTPLLRFLSPYEKLYKPMQDPKWFDAVKSEFKALQANHTWRLVPYHEGMNIINFSSYSINHFHTKIENEESKTLHDGKPFHDVTIYRSVIGAL
ncbi:hypothetical protein ACOSP7_019588 [Xanthoceras sorbifolium]